jgi:hypothetical protein
MRMASSWVAIALSALVLVTAPNAVAGSGEMGQGEFGEGLALSADGNTSVIGAPNDNSSGAAWAFVRESGVWTQQGPKLVGEPSALGKSAALSLDGNTALFGGSYVGSASVFTRENGVWSQQGPQFTGSGASGTDFFSTVALSADGNTALVGGRRDNGEVGAAWVFTRKNGTWTQQGPPLTGNGESGQGQFGVSVALSADGNTALVGGETDNGYVGAAWVFTRSGSTWTQQGSKLTASGESGQGIFGVSVALSSDGDTALIGGGSDSADIGAAWVFTRSGSTWTQQGSKLTGSGESGRASFGTTVALSADGTTALVGGFQDNNELGAAWVFTRAGSTWTQQGSKLTASGEIRIGSFGHSVALSSDGNIALVGAPGDFCGLGAAWIFTRSGSTWTQQEKLTGGGTEPAGCFPLQVKTSTLPAATRGMLYRTELVASGGYPPYRWKKIGRLPKGLTLTSTGVLQGTPSGKLATGSYAVSVRVTDSRGAKKKNHESATATLTLKIN